MNVVRTLVRLPNGKVIPAELGGLTGTGHRIASVKVGSGSAGTRVTVAGRVTTRHGYDSHPLPFEALAEGINAPRVFEGTAAYLAEGEAA